MRHRLLKSTAVALAVAAIAVPLAGDATNPDDGYKSGYPQLHAIHTYNATSPAPTTDEGYKSGYPQLHAIHTFRPQPHRSRAPTAASTGATQPSAREQQP